MNREKKQPDYTSLTGRSALLEDNVLWILTEYADTLVKIDWKRRKLENVFYIPVFRHIDYAFTKMLKIKNKIFIFPHYSNRLFVFDITKESFEEIILPLREMDVTSYTFIDIVAYIDKYLFFAGIGYHGICVLDLQTNRIEIIRDYIPMLKEQGVDIGIDVKKGKIVFSTEFCQKDDKLYIPVYKKNFIIIFDMHKRESVLCKVNEPSDLRLLTISLCGDVFLLTTEKEERILWSQQDGVLEYKWDKTGLANHENQGVGFCKVIEIDNEVYYIPEWRRTLYYEEGSSLKELVFNYPQGNVDFVEFFSTQYEAVFIEEKKIYIQARSNGQFLCLDTEKKKVELIDFDFSAEDEKKIISELNYGSEQIHHEKMASELKVYLKQLL